MRECCGTCTYWQSRERDKVYQDWKARVAGAREENVPGLCSVEKGRRAIPMMDSWYCPQYEADFMKAQA